MANIALPDVFKLHSISPRLVTPGQRNRSLWTGGSKIILGPGKEIWTAKAVFRPLATEGEIRTARAFFYALRGLVNTFDLPVTPTPQLETGSVNLLLVNHAGMSVTAQGGDVYRITKSDVVFGWNADAVSDAIMSGDFLIRINPLQNNSNFMVGVDGDPLNGSEYTTIDRATHFKNTGDIDIWENNVLTASAVASYTAADYFFLQRTGTNLKLYKNNVPILAGATLIHTYTALSGVMGFDSSFLNTGAAADVLVTMTPGNPLAVSGGAENTTTVNLDNAGLIEPGMFATFNLPSGHKRLTAVTAVATPQITFAPVVTENVAVGSVVEITNPVMRVRLADPEFEYEDSNGQVTFSCSVEEAL